jgi:hypothetical protein
MSPPVHVTSGVRELRRLLEERTCDVRTLDLGAFRAWLLRRVARWGRDPVFAQRVAIRDLRRAHPPLIALEAEERRAREGDEASPQHPRLQAVEKELGDAEKAIAGLSAALEGAEEEDRPRLKAKLDGFEARRIALRDEETRLIEASGARREWMRVVAELDRLRSDIGLDREEARLREMLTERGRGSGRSGARFEDDALAALESRIGIDFGTEDDGGRPVRILRSVTLGAARTEIDLLAIRPGAAPDEPAEVLALAEAKRNLNDLGHGFRQRQENLAWLTGDAAAYDPAAYRTRSFPTGHFDRPAVHEQDGVHTLLTRASFRHFRRHPAAGIFLNRLYMITRPGPVWGLSAAALSRIAHRVSTDERWEPESDAYLRRLQRWCRSLAHDVETPDVLRLYAASDERARHVLLVTDR